MNRRLGLLGVPVAAGVAVAVFASPAFAAATWTVVPAQAVGASSGFADVDALSATDAWAVGSTGNGLIERYNGTRWSAVPSPDLLVDHSNPNNFAGLAGVDAVSADTAFAVGSATSVTATGGKSAVVLRWNGTAWSKQAVPNPNKENSLVGVKAFSASDVWAVGKTKVGIIGGQTFAVHWNGSAWTQFPTPSPSTRDNILLSVAGSGPNDVWAVGYFLDARYGSRARHPLTLHWNGTAWSQIASPEIGNAQTVPYAVAAFSPTDAWAVGYTASFGGSPSAIVEHWNGTVWSPVTAPAMSTLSDLTALSSNDLWAIGYGPDGVQKLANWNGAGWTLTNVPATGSPLQPILNAVTARGQGEVWAVGESEDIAGNTGQGQPLAVHTTTG